MSFGVFIRSVGERTEKLCYDSCVRSVSDEKITVIKNIFPAYRAYQEMFRMAYQKKYSWFLGLDADLVLASDWYEKAVEFKKKIENIDWFVFAIAVEDKFLGKISRGNHFYNGKYCEKALDILNKRTWNLTKPESAIRHYVDAKNTYFNETFIGYHGFEQYYCDIFYRFWLRAKRERDIWENCKYLQKDFSEKLLSDYDYHVAELGWNAGKENIVLYRLRLKLPFLFKHMMSNASRRHKLFAGQNNKIIEKEKLNQSLDVFFKKQQ